MLILTRRIGEKLVIGEREIEIVILEVNGQQVKLGITADKAVSIHREEIYQRIEQERADNPTGLAFAPRSDDDTQTMDAAGKLLQPKNK